MGSLNSMSENDKRDFMEYIVKFTKTNEILTKESVKNVIPSSIDTKILKKNIEEYTELCYKYGIEVQKVDLDKNSSALQSFLLFEIYKVYANR